MYLSKLKMQPWILFLLLVNIFYDDIVVPVPVPVPVVVTVQSKPLSPKYDNRRQHQQSYGIKSMTHAFIPSSSSSSSLMSSMPKQYQQRQQRIIKKIKNLCNKYTKINYDQTIYNHDSYLFYSHQQQQDENEKIISSILPTSTTQHQQEEVVEEYDDNSKLDLQLLLLDNYDSYTYNLYSYLCTLCKHKPIVVSNDAYESWDDLIQGLNGTHLDGIIISPGPGRPECKEDMGVCLEAIENNSNIPILGVCLGHQALGYFYNATVKLAPCGPVHGLMSKVWYEQDEQNNNNKNNNDMDTKQLQCNLFDGIPQFFDVVRYHSLVVEFPTSFGSMLPRDIKPIAWCWGDPSNEELNHDKIFGTESYNNDIVCMALKHNQYPHYGVQFHPESVGTGEMGYKILQNFCNFCSDWRLEVDNIINNSSDDKRGHFLNNSNNDHLEPPVSSNLQTTASKYKVLIHKINASDYQDLPLPQEVFETLYASSNTSFWLDSSTGRRNADTDEIISDPNGTRQCPIVSNSRFSILGSSDGPLCKRIEYWGRDHPKSKQGVFLYENDGDESNISKTNTDLISFLTDELHNCGVVKEATGITFYDDDEYGKNKLHTTDIPFDYRGGYVGYIGYEVRHDTRVAMCKQEICRFDQSTHDIQIDQLNISNSQVPTASFIFADKSLLYDHWRGEWYCIGVADNNPVNYESEKSVIDWMRHVSNRLKDLKLDRNILNIPERRLSGHEMQHSSLSFSLARSKEQYTKDIARCHDEIRNGESYELCLTNQLQTKVSFQRGVDIESKPFGLYKILRKKNPSPFAAFMNFQNLQSSSGSVSICCSSPERFLSISQITKSFTGNSSSSLRDHGWEFAPPFAFNSLDEYANIVESKPIKGTTKRKFVTDDTTDNKIDFEEDSQVAETLRTSIKNRAENLMIVDLLRNDLSRVCVPGSVHVPKLMAIESFATVHQMVSTIRGVVKSDETPIDVISACFPGGSMTGAPKLRSIDILNEIELGKSRGPYSGCLGYISLNGCMDLNIIIRTAVVTRGTSANDDASEHDSFDNTWNVSIGAGGAITALSECEDEFDEMLLKSRAIRDAVQQWSDSGKEL